MEGNLLRPQVPYATAAETDALTEKVWINKYSEFVEYTENKQSYAAFQLRALLQYSGIKCSGLNVIQVVWHTPANPQKGKTQINIPNTPKGTNPRYDAFVDGGRFSPNVVSGEYSRATKKFRVQKVAREGKPYFCYDFTAKKKREIWLRDYEGRVTKQMENDFNALDWEAAQVLRDAQEAALVHEICCYSSLVVAVNYKGTSRDKMLGRIKWRFKDFGIATIHGATAQKIKDVYQPVDVKLALSTRPTSPERDIIRNDYPDYKFYGED